MKFNLKLPFKKLSLPRISFKKLTPEKRREILTSAITVAASLAVAALILGGAANLLGGITEKNSHSKVFRAMERAIPAEVYEKIEPEFDAAEEIRALYAAKTEGELLGYCVHTEAKGYKNPIEILVAMSPEGAVTKVEVLSVKETSGYGSRMEDEAFLSQFEGKSAELTLVRGKTDKEDKISAVSGATVSSNAVKDGVNHAIGAISQIRAAEAKKEAREAERARLAASAAELVQQNVVVPESGEEASE